MDYQEKRAFKMQLYEQFALIGKALANAHRLELLDVLAQGEHSVEVLAQECALSIANASQHLQILRAAHLVAVRREGTYLYYRLADESVFAMWQAMRTVGETHLAEIGHIVRTFLHEREQLQPISAQELLAMCRDDQVTVLDVRPANEYQAGHLPHARSMPIEELEARLTELSPQKTVVAYCRGPYCVFADEAVTLLRKHGYQARRLEQGFPDWNLLRLPTETESV